MGKEYKKRWEQDWLTPEIRKGLDGFSVIAGDVLAGYKLTGSRLLVLALSAWVEDSPGGVDLAEIMRAVGAKEQAEGDDDEEE